MVQASLHNIQQTNLSSASSTGGMHNDILEEITSLRTQIKSMEEQEAKAINVMQQEIAELKRQMKNTPGISEETEGSDRSHDSSEKQQPAGVLKKGKKNISFAEEIESQQLFDGSNEDDQLRVGSKDAIGAVQETEKNDESRQLSNNINYDELQVGSTNTIEGVRKNQKRKFSFGKKGRKQRLRDRELGRLSSLQTKKKPFLDESAQCEAGGKELMNESASIQREPEELTDAGDEGNIEV
uniref:Uncharacterized protein n=1 Tax=Thalassionema nitzschioides TaxID=33649 RepID=A0A7S1E3H3_9STRA